MVWFDHFRFFVVIALRSSDVHFRRLGAIGDGHENAHA